MSRDKLIQILRAEYPGLSFMSDGELIRRVAKNENNDHSPTLVEMCQRQIEEPN